MPYNSYSIALSPIFTCFFLAPSIGALVDNQKQLLQLKDIGFSPTNVASILHGSGTKCIMLINVLLNKQEVLIKVMKDNQLTATNIAYNLSSSSKLLDKKIEDLVAKHK